MEISDGEVRPADGQVHGRLPALPRRRGAQGGQRLHRQAQGNEVHPIRGLVSGLKLKTKLQMIMTNYHIYFEREQSRLVNDYDLDHDPRTDCWEEIIRIFDYNRLHCLSNIIKGVITSILSGIRI